MGGYKSPPFLYDPESEGVGGCAPYKGTASAVVIYKEDDLRVREVGEKKAQGNQSCKELEVINIVTGRPAREFN